jgi:hypothetical protein
LAARFESIHASAEGEPMKAETVISREYKIMLRSKVFAGGDQQLLQVASNFWHDFKQAIDKTVGDKDGNLAKINNRRTIEFYDTDDHRLNKNSYIFRKRVNLDTGGQEVTLKFRHPDRYLSQDRNMKAADSDIAKTKFEEDIKPAFVTLYSYSTTQKISDTTHLRTMKDVARLYPALSGEVDDYDEHADIEVINGFTAREVVVEGAKFRVGKEPKIESDCALIVWYDDRGDPKKPVVAEFSFRYGNKGGEYEKEVAHRSYTVFQILQEDLPTWIDPDSKTKTAFVFG